jgi:hypothetical protein
VENDLMFELQESIQRENDGFMNRVYSGDFPEEYRNDPKDLKSNVESLEAAYADVPTNEQDLAAYKPFMDLAEQIYDKHHQPTDKPRFDENGQQVDKPYRVTLNSPAAKAQWALSYFSWFENNMTKMVLDSAKLGEADMAYVTAFAKARKMYKDTDISTRQVVEGTFAMFSDPVNYLGFGLAGKAVGTAIKASAFAGVLNKLVNNAGGRYTAATAAGAASGAVYGGVDGAAAGYTDETIQSISQNQPFDRQAVKNEMLSGAAVGAAVGATLPVLWPAGSAMKKLWDKFSD